MSGLFNLGNPPVSLTTVATYGDLPASPSLNQACFVTDVSSVYQWDGAQWVLLTTITVATSGDLPSTGVDSGDKALVGDNQIWTKNVGIGWTQSVPVDANVAPNSTTLALGTAASGEIDWNADALVGLSFTLTGAQADDLTLDVDLLAVDSGGARVLTVTRANDDAIGAGAATVEWTATDGSSGEVEVTASSFQATADHWWAFASGGEDTGAGSAITMAFGGTARAATTLPSCAGQIELDSNTDYGKIASVDVSRGASKTVVILWSQVSITNSRCIFFGGPASGANSWGFLAVDGGGKLVWQDEGLTNRFELRNAAAFSAIGTAAQMAVLRYNHGGTSTADHNYTGGTRSTTTFALASNTTGTVNAYVGGNTGDGGGTYHSAAVKVGKVLIFNSLLSNDQVTRLFQIAGMT